MIPGNTKQPAGAATAGRGSLLGLRIPKLSPPAADSILLDPKRVDDWLQALPIANIGETGRQVFNTLVRLNREDVPDLTRAKVIEKFREPVHYLVRNLEKHYLNLGFPLSNKSWKIAVLSRELQAELAMSYKIIAERMVSGDSAQFDKKLLVIALHRALWYMSRVLLNSALIYSPWPPMLWREINAVYAYAWQNGINKVPVKFGGESSSRKASTIEHLYKSLLLFSAAATFRLRQPQIRQLHRQLDTWAELTELIQEDTLSNNAGRFNVDLWADDPPIHNSLRPPPKSKRFLILDARGLLKKLTDDFEHAAADDGHEIVDPEQITRPLLKELIKTWNRPPERQFVRTRLHFELHVVAGFRNIFNNLVHQSDDPLSAIHSEFLDTSHPTSDGKSGNYSATENKWAESRISGLSLAPLEGAPATSPDSRLSDSYLSLSSAPLSEDPLDVWSDTVGTHSIATFHVQTLNESAGGYCIRWSGIEAPKLKVGELVGIQSASSTYQYALGITRWIKHQGNAELDIGLQILATRCEAAELTIAPQGPERPNMKKTKCLVLPISKNDPNNEISSLVTSDASYKIGTTLWLRCQGKDSLIRLTNKIESTSAFVRYQFNFPDDKKSDRKGDTDFDDLWNNI